MKKLLCVLLMCLTLLFTLSACEDFNKLVDILDKVDLSPSASAPTELPKPTQPPHECQAEEGYVVDRENHHTVCSCGKRLSTQAHELENQVCAVCKAKLSAEEILGLHYVWVEDDEGNVIRAQCYSGKDWMRTYTHEYTYGENGQILGKRSYADGVIYASSTWDEKGNLLTKDEYDGYGHQTDSYRYSYVFDAQGRVDSVLTERNGEPISKQLLDAHGRVLEENTYSQYSDVNTVYQYDDSGNLSEVQQFTNNTLTRKGFYALQGKKLYLQKEYTYDAQGNYTLQRYNSLGKVIARHSYDAKGNPLDLSRAFSASACAPLLGSWSGEMTIDSSMLGLDLPNFQLKAQFYIELDDQGLMRVICAMEEEEYRQALITATIELMKDQFGRERSLEEMNIMSLATYRKPMYRYVEETVKDMDLDGLIYQEMHYFYYVKNGKLYTADSCKSLAEASPFTLNGDRLTFTDPNSALSVSLTRGGAAPLPPSANTEPHPYYNPKTCAPLFGVWEGTFQESDIVHPDLSVEVTIRLTFLEDGRVLVQKKYDPQAYYEYVLAKRVEGVYKSYAHSYGYTRKQADEAFLKEHGVTIQEYEAAQLPPLSKMLPKDYYDYYYIDHYDDELLIGYTMTSYQVTEDTLILSSRKAVFTKIG